MSHVGNAPTDQLISGSDIDPAFVLAVSNGGTGGTSLKTINGASIVGSGNILTELPLTTVTVTDTSAINTFELCAASSAIVRTIPTGTSVGDSIGYKDGGQNFATYSLTITPPSGHQIEDLAANETLVVTTRYLSFELKQVSAGIWRIF